MSNSTKICVDRFPTPDRIVLPLKGTTILLVGRCNARLLIMRGVSTAALLRGNTLGEAQSDVETASLLRASRDLKVYETGLHILSGASSTGSKPATARWSAVTSRPASFPAEDLAEDW